MKKHIIWILVCTLILGVAVQAAPSRAAVTVGVSPSLIELSGKPNSTGNVDLNVLNQGDEPFDISVASDAYSRAPERSNADWLTPSITTAHIDTGSQVVVPVAIAIPEDADPGGHYATIKITTGAPDGSGNSAGISGQLIVPFLITVEGKYKRKAEVTNFAGFLELDGRLGFRAEATNEGEIHWKPASLVTINKGDGSDYGTLEVDNSTVFPQSDVTLATTSTLPVTTGDSYQAEIALDYGAKKPVKAKTEFTFTPDFTVNGSVCENLDRGPTMAAKIDNTGSLGLITNVSMVVKSADGTPIGQTGMIGPNPVWPKTTGTVGTDLPDRLATGDYILTIQYQTGAATDPVSIDLPFSIGGTGPNVAPICPQPEATPGA